MEIPEIVVTGAAGAVVLIGGVLGGAVRVLYRDLRRCEKASSRALKIARYEVEAQTAAGPSVAPPMFGDDEDTAVRRIDIERNRKWFERRARARADFDPLLRDYLDSERPGPVKRIRKFL